MEKLWFPASKTCPLHGDYTADACPACAREYPPQVESFPILFPFPINGVSQERVSGGLFVSSNPAWPEPKYWPMSSSEPEYAGRKGDELRQAIEAGTCTPEEVKYLARLLDAFEDVSACYRRDNMAMAQQLRELENPAKSEDPAKALLARNLAKFL